MLKLNTVLTGAGLLLMTLLGFLGKDIWDNVKETRAALVLAVTKQETEAARLESMKSQVDDHETRIRTNEKDITKLQEDRQIYRSPKMSENNTTINRN